MAGVLTLIKRVNVLGRTCIYFGAQSFGDKVYCFPLTTVLFWATSNSHVPLLTPSLQMWGISLSI